MYNFNRPTYPPVNSPQYSSDNQIRFGPRFSPHSSTPVGLYQRPSPTHGRLPDPKFFSSPGNSSSFGGSRYPPPVTYSSPFVPPPRAHLPWSPTPSYHSARMNSHSFHTGVSWDSGPLIGGHYDSSCNQSSYVTGNEPGRSSQTSFDSSRSTYISMRSGSGACATESRWKRGDPITRSLSDPWFGLTATRTPDSGGCLVANPLVQRHTVLFAPLDNRRRKADEAELDSHGYDDDDSGPLSAKRLSSGV